MLIDEAEIYVSSGRGGDGMVHFCREKFIPRGGPDGGDGGRGGDVIFRVSPKLNTLSLFRYKSRFMAADGRRGGPKNQTGRSAEDLILEVPPGTIIYDIESGSVLADLVEQDQTFVVCKGGRGGKGNTHFATSTNQAPRIGERGEPGQERNLRIVLKLIADVGIVGVPNAGKSSFLSAVTNAKPKIADYPITTLEPNLGVVELDEETSMVLADIPGLIEGAHRGVGLGNTFLKHFQRTRVLIHILDGSAEDPLADFSQINSEMALFDPNLSKKPQLVVFNKIDLPEVKERWTDIRKTLKKKGYEVLAISALTRQDLQPVLWKVAELLQTAPFEQVSSPEVPIYRPEEDARDFSIEPVEGGYRVKGAAIFRAAEMTYWQYPASVRRFQKLMERLGVEDALRRAGAKNGDTVYIGEYELDWED